jgi:hypothetical protein
MALTETLGKFSAASATLPALFPLVRVRFVEGVTSLAVRSGRIALAGQLRTHAAAQILAHRHRLKMHGIHAVPDPAEMVERKALWDRPDQQLVGITVGTYLPAADSASTDMAVSMSESPGPQPARLGLLNFGPEALLDGSFRRQLIATLRADIVLATETASIVWGFAMGSRTSTLGHVIASNQVMACPRRLRSVRGRSMHYRRMAQASMSMVSPWG